MSELRSCIIVDQHPVVRLGLAGALSGEWSCEECEDVEAAEEMIRSYGGYDAAIVELRRANGSGAPGTAAVRRLRDAAPGIGIVAHGPRADGHAIDAARRAGALAYLGAFATADAIRSAAAAAADGNRFIDPDATATASRTLTRRQIEVLQHLANGASTEQTANRLGLSEQTVRTHAKGILSRLHANGRAHAVALAIRAGLID